MALQFDNAAQPSVETASSNVPTAVPLETHDPLSHETKVSGELLSSPRCLKSSETTPHLQIEIAIQVAKRQIVKSCLKGDLWIYYLAV